MFHKTIVSRAGRQTTHSAAVGDTVRFRISYRPRRRYGQPLQSATTRPGVFPIDDLRLDSGELLVTDPLDRGLGDIVVLDGGRYDPSNHQITWLVNERMAARKPYVEFEARATRAGTIRNQASVAQVGPRRGQREPLGETNAVELEVRNPVDLGWIPFRHGAQPGEPPRAYMKDETSTGVTLRFDIPGVFVREELVDGVTYHRLSLPGWASLTDEGKPELPIVGEVIEIPHSVSVDAKVVETERVELTGYHIYPSQPPQIDFTEAQPEFVINEDIYASTKPYPSTVAALAKDDIAVIRGHRLAFVKIYPFQYRPADNNLTVLSTIEVTVTYDRPAQLGRIQPRLDSSPFEELLEATVANYKDPLRFYHPQAESESEEHGGCDYLIITDDNLHQEGDTTQPLARLADWKRRKGYRTRTVKVGDIPGVGNTEAAIQAYLKGAYENWNPPPTYVLFVGDSDLIVSCAGTDPHPSHNPPTRLHPPVQTDLYYVTVDGSDDFSDIYMGRLSASNTQQLTDIIDKILSYEQNPPDPIANPDFFTTATLIAEFEDMTGDPAVANGQEDRPWIANMEAIRDHLQDENYNVERFYRTDSGFPATANAQVPLRFHDGSNLPVDLVHPNYAWNAQTQDVINAFDAGRFLVTYRAHGGASGWGTPAPGFRTGNLANLNQNDLTPVVVSITCQTGWFDNETDDDSQGGRGATNDCFAEAITRQARCGAVALFGMTRNSWSGWNDHMVFGLHRAIWPTFFPTPASTYPGAVGIGNVRLLRMGQILDFMKIYMAMRYEASDTRKLHFEMCHLFGDPEMAIWTEAPSELEVVHPAGIGSVGDQRFVVSVQDKDSSEPVRNATVTLTRGEHLIAWQQTDSAGITHFDLQSPGAGDLDVTVTGLNLRPYLGSMAVVAGGAVLDRLDPGNGPIGQVIQVGGRHFDPNESVELRFGSQAVSTVTTDAAGEFGHGNTPATMDVPTQHPHGLVNVVARGQSSGRSAVRVFQVRDENPVDLWTYDQQDPSTWTVHPGDNPTWNSPDIQLYNTSGQEVASNNLNVGEDYVVKFNVRNASTFDAEQANVVLRWRNWGTGGPWEEVHPGVDHFVDVPGSAPHFDIAEIDFAPHETGHLCIKATIEHVEDINRDNNTGQENLHVGSTTSPEEICFVVANETTAPGPVHLEVRQLRQPWNEQDERLWATWVRHPEPQILGPGERAEACVIIDPDPADVKPGTEAEFAVTAFVGREMVGGVNILLVKAG